MRKTKIVATLGPASNSVEQIKALIEAGISAARLNFSHGDHEEHGARIANLKQAREELGAPIPIILDTKGPEIRTKDLVDGKKVQLEEGQTFTITTDDIVGDNTRVAVTYEDITKDLSVGSTILIDDGLIAFKVEKVEGTEIVCRALNGGPLSNRKSVNVPGIKLNMPYISEKDRSDVIFGCSQGIDFIAASFCRSAQDMRDLKAILKEQGCEDVEIIAKIENMDGVNNIDEILDEVNGIMVARGDLGVEVPFEELPAIQKNLIKKCISRGRRVVTATQMLESMAKNPRPTRAEVSDVANAVYDGTSAIMLSGETSVGKYPVETVAAMSSIAENAEANIHYDRRRITRPEFMDMELGGERTTNAISHAVCTTAADLDAKCIVAFTESGSTARAVSCRRPGKIIVGATPSEKTYNRLTMSWGIIPCMVKRPESGSALYVQALNAAVRTAGVKADDTIIITAGMPVGHVNYTNTMRAMKVTEESINIAIEE